MIFSARKGSKAQKKSFLWKRGTHKQKTISLNTYRHCQMTWEYFVEERWPGFLKGDEIWEMDQIKSLKKFIFSCICIMKANRLNLPHRWLDHSIKNANWICPKLNLWEAFGLKFVHHVISQIKFPKDAIPQV